MQIEYDDPDISEFLAACTKQFCPWCGAPVVAKRMGWKKKFCSGIIPDGVQKKSVKTS